MFFKVAVLAVKDFDALCSIGLFGAEKMNQGIFGFRKYENSSLSYAGIGRHEGEAVGGWGAVLRRDEYEALYCKQQAAMAEAARSKEEASLAGCAAADSRQVAAPPSLDAGTIVVHPKFGEGKVASADKRGKYIRVDFSAGEKTFAMDSAFKMGFLRVK